MAQNSKIWVGPGSLRAVSDFKGKKIVLPGDEIPKGFVSNDRIKQLEKLNKICSESAFTKRQAASGVVPVADAAVIIRSLESEVKVLEKENKELTEGAGISADVAKKIEGLENANKALTEGVALSSEEADNKIKDFEAKIGELEDINQAFEEEVSVLEEGKKTLEAEIVSLKKATKKGDK